MLNQALLVLASLAAIVGVVSALLYPFRCKALENHLNTSTPDYAEDKEGFGNWYKTRWALDKLCKRTGLYGIAAYGVGMFSLFPVQASFRAAGNSSHLPTILMLVLTACMLTVGILSVFHNDREFELDLKRRYPGARL